MLSRKLQARGKERRGEEPKKPPKQRKQPKQPQQQKLLGPSKQWVTRNTLNTRSGVERRCHKRKKKEPLRKV